MRKGLFCHHMKRLLIVALIIAIGLMTGACGGGDSADTPADNATVTEEAPADEPPVAEDTPAEDETPVAEELPAADESAEEPVDDSDETVATAIHAFDVEEGLALLIDADKTEIVIDGGYKKFGEPFADYIEPYVDGNIELVIATHSHADHVGGLPSVYDEYQVDKTIYGDKGSSGQFKAFWKAANDERNSSVVNDEDMTIDLGEGLSLATIEAFDDDSNTNNNSVVSLLDIDGVKMLVTGDAEDKTEKSLSGKIGDVDVFYVGHHGSETSNTLSFLEEIAPELCIISSEGPAGQYENPNWDVMKRLLAFTPDIFATYMSGTLVVTVDDGDVSVSADGSERLTLDNYGGTQKANDSAGKDAEKAKKKTPKKDAGSGTAVYVTDSGEKYHADGCRYLKKSKHKISLADAKKQGYKPCSVCNPPE
jgi:beta-lactamase superfamily II metal-dependent hydrolase